MKFACPGCAADLSANPPKLGRFTLKCTGCGGALVLKVSLATLADEKAAAQREKSLASFATSAATDPDRTNASGADRPRAADPDQTNVSVA